MISENTQYLILDQVYGWNEIPPARLGDSLATSVDGNRQLFGLPGRSALLLDGVRQEKAFVCPSAAAVGGSGTIAVVDGETARVSLVELDGAQIDAIPTIGGQGSSARSLFQPRGIAFLKSGALVIADTANHRVQIFSETQHALVQTWGAIDQLGNPMPGTDKKEFNLPWSVAADECGAVFIVDR